MKKLITLCVMLVTCMATSFADNTATIYVKADAAPYLYVWQNESDELNGDWPGTPMSETTIVKGATFYTKTISYTADGFNLILNDNQGNQTSDISGDGDIYLTYNGSKDFSNVTELLANPYTVVGEDTNVLLRA